MAKSEYNKRYEKEHYKKFQMRVRPEIAAAIRHKMEMEGYKSMKDFFFALFRDEYHIDLNRVPDEVPPEE